MPDLTRDGQYGVFDVQLARQIAARYRQQGLQQQPESSMIPPTIVPFAAVAEISHGEMIQFRDEFVVGFGDRESDDDVAYFRNHALMKAGLPESDADLQYLRRRTWGVSICDVAAPDGDQFNCGIAIVSGPACIECVKGDATVDACGNFIVPWTDKTNGGKGEVRPYGIARCMEQEPDLEGWMWVMMGACKWEFTCKTVGAHNKGASQAVAIHFGGTKGSEPATGLTQVVYNRFDDVGDDIWAKAWYECDGPEFDAAEC